MQKNTLHKIYAILAIVLASTILAPHVGKLLHSCCEHHHETNTCKNHEGTHFHDSSKECDFCKHIVKLNSTTPVINSITSVVKHSYKHVFSHKEAYTDSFQHFFYLRGPPSA